MIPIRSQRRQALAPLSTAITLLSVTSSAADILIVASNAPALKPGIQLAETAKLEIPAGTKVRVLLPSGATLAITGPASRQVKDVTKGEPLVESVWAKAKEIFETGGVDQSRPGATRGGSGTNSIPTSGFAWNEIGIALSGNVCVEKGASLVMLRPEGSRLNEITVIDTAGNARSRLTWKEGDTRADWPASLQPRADTVYQVVATGQPARQIRLKLIDKSHASEERALRTLLENDCSQQARAWSQTEP